MAKDPAFLFYPGDWQGGTTLMNRFLKGCYIDLLVAQFNHGPLANEEVKTVLGMDYDKAWPSLKKKFQTDANGLFFNARLATEQKKRAEHSKLQKQRITDYWTKKKKLFGEGSENTTDYTAVSTEANSKHDTARVPLENRNENRNEDIIEDGKGGSGEKQKFQNIMGAQIWIEQIAMKKHMKAEKVCAYLDNFLNDLILREEFGKPEPEIKKHFILWLNQQLKHKNEPTTTHQAHSAGNSGFGRL